MALSAEVVALGIRYHAPCNNIVLCHATRLHDSINETACQASMACPIDAPAKALNPRTDG